VAAMTLCHSVVVASDGKFAASSPGPEIVLETFILLESAYLSFSFKNTFGTSSFTPSHISLCLYVCILYVCMRGRYYYEMNLDEMCAWLYVHTWNESEIE
jgi:hypothetical protein